LNFLGIRPEIVHNLGYVRKRRRADIGAVCEAEEDEKEFPAKLCTRPDTAFLIRKCKDWRESRTGFGNTLALGGPPCSGKNDHRRDGGDP
jgi:hypothetical protein